MSILERQRLRPQLDLYVNQVKNSNKTCDVMAKATIKRSHRLSAQIDLLCLRETRYLSTRTHSAILACDGGVWR